MNCPDCGVELDPARHCRLVCDGEVWCDGCRRYDRRLLEPRSWEELAAWNERLAEAFDFAAPVLRSGPPPPPPGPFDFLEDHKLLMAEAHHRQGVITLYPAGCRLATLCHELAHLITGHDHTAAWARTCARLVAWVKARLPEDHSTRGFSVKLL